MYIKDIYEQLVKMDRYKCCEYVYQCKHLKVLVECMFMSEGAGA